MDHYVTFFLQLLDEWRGNQEAAWQNFRDLLACLGVEQDRMEEIETYVMEEWEHAWTE